MGIRFRKESSVCRLDNVGKITDRGRLPEVRLGTVKGNSISAFADPGNQVIQPINMVADNLGEFQPKMFYSAILQTDMSLTLGMIGGNLQRILAKVPASFREKTARESTEISVDQVNWEPFYQNDFSGDTVELFTECLQHFPLRTRVV